MKYLEPKFFIIGERKCGTSSLYRYLIEHPQVLPCAVKEPQFFSKSAWHRFLHYSNYRKLFPKVGENQMQIKWYNLNDQGTIETEYLTFTADPHRAVITGEASANTLAQVPPERLHRAFPEARLIACLRHPVDRAYAHYRMLERFASEGRRIPVALTDFKQDFIEDIRKYRVKGKGVFASASFYYEHLKHWMRIFDKDQFYILRVEDMADENKAARIMKELCVFLGIDDFDFSEILQQRENVSSSDPLDPELRAQLSGFYAEDVNNLESLTEIDFHWEV